MIYTYNRARLIELLQHSFPYRKHIFILPEGGLHLRVPLRVRGSPRCPFTTIENIDDIPERSMECACGDDDCFAIWYTAERGDPRREATERRRQFEHECELEHAYDPPLRGALRNFRPLRDPLTGWPIR